MDSNPALLDAMCALRVATSGAAPVAVYEDRGRYAPPARYEDEGSERSSMGAVYMTSDSAWRATLSVPLPNADAVFLRLERTGRLPAGYRQAEESASLSVPVTELEVVAEVLTSVIAQAKRDGVLG